MTHDYLAEIHNYISQEIVIAEQKKDTAKDLNDFESLHFYKGQINELFKIREYLTEIIDLKTQEYY